MSNAKPARCRSLTVRGSRWKVRWVNNLGDNYGICDYAKKEIRIAKGQPTATELDTVVHELLHAALPDLDEPAIAETAEALATALVKLGFVQKHP
jgi:hypothetical protein